MLSPLSTPFFFSFIVSMISNNQDLVIQLESKSLIKQQSIWVKWIRAREIKTRDSRQLDEYSKRSGCSTVFKFGENCLSARFKSQSKETGQKVFNYYTAKGCPAPRHPPDAEASGQDTEDQPHAHGHSCLFLSCLGVLCPPASQYLSPCCCCCCCCCWEVATLTGIFF